MDDELEMAERFFGFGRWDAPYWFIGPEPGGDNNPLRAKVWSEKFKKAELCDCNKFHKALAEAIRGEGGDSGKVEEVEKFFREPPKKPALQKTWRKLMLLLEAYRPELIDLSDPHTYQRDSWGSVGVNQGKTCVIELSGLSARNSAESSKRNKEINEECLRRRICVIRDRLQNLMQSSLKRPELVVVYGEAWQRDWEQAKLLWEQITGPGLVFNSAVRCGNTVFVFAYHPNARGNKGDYWLKDLYWESLGTRAREVSNGS
jgi:hypothetical protein